MLKIIKRIAKVILRNQGYEVRKQPTFLLQHPTSNFSLSLEVAIKSILCDKKQLSLLQIGAYDGVSNDPVHNLIQKYPIRAILAEPNIDAFRKLAASYAGEQGVILENIAVAEKDGVKTFFVLKGENCPFEQYSSFSKETILSHKRWYPDIEKWIHEETVHCKTVSTLLKENQFEQLEVLVLDIEGYEEDVIRSIDFERVAPRIIYYESCHLSNDKQENLLRFLLALGYKFSIQGADTFDNDK